MLNFFTVLKNYVTFDKKRAIVGSILGILSFFIATVFWHSWKYGICLLVAYCLSSYIKLNIQQERVKYLINIFSGIIYLASLCFITAIMLSFFQFIKWGLFKALLNILCVFFINGIVFLVVSQWRKSYFITSILLMIYSTINYFVCQFRGMEITPADFFSISTALNVVGQYDITTITSSLLMGWMIFGIVTLCVFIVPKTTIRLHTRTRAALLLAEILMFLAVLLGSLNIPAQTWRANASAKNGYYLNFVVEARNMIIKEPQGYSKQVINNIENQYLTDNEPTEQKSPNVIIIMSESYADFNVVGKLETNKPVTPFFDSLKENVVRGHALSSVFGANTANSEFELLTGHSMAFLPSGTVPYNQYIDGNTYTLAWLMKTLGYETFATHPYLANGWSREKLYPTFGFSESTFIENYPNKNLIREYISDQEMYEYVIDKVTNRNDSGPIFLFGITMQNHGGYDYKGENFKQTITLTEYPNKYPLAEQYLSLLNESDKALEYFLTELEDYPEDTIVLFFGDHLPKLETEFYEEINGSPVDTFEEQLEQYKVPFFIWANYDIPEKNVECTSLNYLSAHLIDYLNIELPPYYQFLKEAEENIPAINALGYYSISQNKFIALDEATGNEADWLNKYSFVQYNNIFDDDKSELLFKQYISIK